MESWPCFQNVVHRNVYAYVTKAADYLGRNNTWHAAACLDLTSLDIIENVDLTTEAAFSSEIVVCT
jgi:hypothetical protein